MSCILGIIGGAIGSLIGGTPGAFIGFWIGSMIGNSTTDNSATATRQTQQQQQASRFFDALMLLAAHVIQADGRIMHSEMETVRNFLRVNGFGENGVLLGDQLLRKHFDYYKVYGRDAWENQVRNACFDISSTMPIEHRTALIAFLADIAKADGHIDREEVDAIRFIAANLSLDPAIADQFLATSGNYGSLDEAYKVFGISSDATDDEVRKAYRKLVLQYHPDKVAHLGEEIKANANRKLQEINKARDLIFQARNMK